MISLRTAGRLGLRAAVMEVRLYATLVRWALRRQDVPAGAEPWGYAALVAPMLWLWIFGSATETVVFHLIIPWETVRLVVDIISMWGLLWMLGTLAAYRIRPHLLMGGELRVRNSIYHDLSIPLDAIVSGAARESTLPSAMYALQVATDEHGAHVSVGVSGQTNIVLHLRTATAIHTAKGVVPAETVRFWVDEPRAFLASLDRRLTQVRS